MSDTNTSPSTDGSASGKVSRRDFIAGVGGLGLGAIIAGTGVATIMPKDDIYAVEASDGYLLIDSKKCGACETCMLACSLAHSGRTNLNLSRIQVGKNPLGNFPVDVVQNQCRQCPYPACVEACPTNAMHVDPGTKVRLVAEEKCIGCERCINACPFTPSRVQWNYEDRNAQKCDLCLNTPHWDQEGGPNGKQACMEVCPMKAISFTNKVPTQNEEGYDVNLRNEHWAIAGFPIDDKGKVHPAKSVPVKASAAEKE